MMTMKTWRNRLFRPFPLSLGQIRTTRGAAGTYYDSQSGQHVPVHNPEEIRLLLNLRKSFYTCFSTQFYKQQEDQTEVSSQIQSWRDSGFVGAILPSPEFPRDERNQATFVDLAGPIEFTVFSSAIISSQSQIPSHCSIVVEYKSAQKDIIQPKLQSLTAIGFDTTIAVNVSEHLEQDSAISLANDVASVIDETGAGNPIWIRTSGDCGDGVLEVCEELSYLDVAGPTMQSRLIVDFIDDEDVLYNVVPHRLTGACSCAYIHAYITCIHLIVTYITLQFYITLVTWHCITLHYITLHYTT